MGTVIRCSVGRRWQSREMLEAGSAQTGTGQGSGVRMRTGQGAELSAGRHERQVDVKVNG